MRRWSEAEREDAAAWRDTVMRATQGLCQQCGDPAVHAHHVVTQQKVRDRARELQVDAAWLLWDARNGVALCEPCHRRHHNRRSPITAPSLPPAAAEFAADFGFGEWLDRFYPPLEAAA